MFDKFIRTSRLHIRSIGGSVHPPAKTAKLVLLDVDSYMGINWAWASKNCIDVV